MIQARDLHWAAGFLEGEGCFDDDTGRGLARTHVGQCQREPLERLQSLFGGSIRIHRRAHGNRKTYHMWRLSGAGLLLTMYGLMSPRRKQQIRKALRVWRSIPPHNGKRRCCKRGHEFTVENTFRWRNNKRGDTQRRCRACRNQERARLARRVRIPGVRVIKNRSTSVRG
jgi:hypothetical protein